MIIVTPYKLLQNDFSFFHLWGFFWQMPDLASAVPCHGFILIARVPLHAEATTRP